MIGTQFHSNCFSQERIQVMAGPSSSAVPGSCLTNYARIGHAAQQLFPDILQELITIKEPPHRLSGDVNANRYLSKNLRHEEFSMINDVVTKGYANFDIPFIYKLVRNLNLVPPPTKGWNYPTAPSPTEVTTGDDIERIRRFRNETLHRGNAQVTDTELSQYFTEFKNIAVRLEINLGKRPGEFVHKFVDLETCCMDEKISTIYIERLDRLKKSEEDCRKRLHAIEKDVDVLKKRRNINSMDAKNREIDKVKLPVSSVELVEVTKVGIQGSGKSTIGKAIIKQFCEVNTEYDIVELPTTEYPKESYFGGFGLFIQPRSRYKIVVFLDDLFGRIPTKYAFKEHLMLLKCVNERKDILGLKILITVHSETKACLEELFASDTLLSTAGIINLPFGMHPRRNMLKAIGIDEKRSDNILRQMEETRVQERIGFPALVSILKGHPEFGDKLFTNPTNVLMNYLSSLNNGNTHDKMYFVILIHVLMTGTVLEKHELLKDEIEKEKNSMCAISKILFGDELEFDKVSIETITDEKGITDEQGDGILVNKSDPHYSHYLFCFQQDVIRDFVFRSYKAKGVKEIITTCSLNCIVSYFRPSTDTAGEPFVCIDSSLYPTVASQIISIIQEDLNISVSDGINSVKTLCLSPLLQAVHVSKEKRNQ
ncbi:unnamed protein product [Mytilus edulis]|uniref:DZIP3-like HEPN domain-containing protein n=1 Tax=Mytilus edulis TaxID=6550 RepID=A0A8S3QVA9_MYTED|nr:unnamed protein product [Mytilus edulis]